MTVPAWVHMADVPPAVDDEPCRHEWEWTDWMGDQSRVIEWIEWCRLCYRHRADVEEPAPGAPTSNPARADVWYTPDCGYQHLSEDGAIYGRCPDGVPHWSSKPRSRLRWVLLAIVAAVVLRRWRR